MIKSELELFKQYIYEREKIRVRRASGQIAPWTNDIILQRYSFTNVCRTDDKDTKWILNKIISHDDWTAAGLISFISISRNFQSVEKIYNTIKEYHESNHKSKFSPNASYQDEQMFDYLIKNNKMKKSETNYKSNLKINYLKTPKLIKQIKTNFKSFDDFSPKKIWDKLMSLTKHGKFMTTQILLDIRMLIKHYINKNSNKNNLSYIINNNNNLINIINNNIINLMKYHYKGSCWGYNMIIFGNWKEKAIETNNEIINNKKFIIDELIKDKKITEIVSRAIKEDEYNINNWLCEFAKYSSLKKHYEKCGKFKNSISRKNRYLGDK